jgi:hypothetical protein
VSDFCAACLKFTDRAGLRVHPVFHRLRLCVQSEDSDGCYENYTAPGQFAAPRRGSMSMPTDDVQGTVVVVVEEEECCRVCGERDGGDLIVCDTCKITNVCTGCIPVFCPGYGDDEFKRLSVHQESKAPAEQTSLQGPERSVHTACSGLGGGCNLTEAFGLFVACRELPHLLLQR